MYSVIIPTYNRCDSLLSAIESVFDQAYSDIEIIVIDDGSTDRTALTLAEYYPSVRYFYQVNQGPAAARNMGIQKSCGNVIALLDSDDIWMPHKVSTDLHFLNRYPEADFISGNSMAFLEGKLRAKNVYTHRGIEFDNDQPRYFDWSMDIMRYGPVCCTSTMTFRRSLLDSFGKQPFDEVLRFDEDWDFEFRLFSRHKALLYPIIVCESRVFDDGTRDYYSSQDREKSRDEKIRIWTQQHHIISRHIDKISSIYPMAYKYSERQQELVNMVAELEQLQMLNRCKC